uniref:RNase H type-1 domain-containing protein n=2 Tax=Nicotiana TaxID=4085 RepID=A0A1S4C624_TOBAC|nr:PREDICTED: uncharacterized protein LOC107815485 [Nicotiana tabacum]
MKLNPEKYAFGAASGLELAEEVGIEQVEIKSDSQLMYLEKVRELLRQFQVWKVVQIPREENMEADALTNLGVVADVSNTKNAMVLEESKGNWPEVLPRVLWAYRTTTKISTVETPFLLVYGTEAFIPEDIGEPSTRFKHANEASDEEEFRTNLDLIEERREIVLIWMAMQKQRNERYYNRSTNLRYFKIWDFVLKKVLRSTHAANVGKLSPNWESPYRVKDITGKGAYELDTMDGKMLPSN